MPPGRYLLMSVNQTYFNHVAYDIIFTLTIPDTHMKSGSAIKRIRRIHIYTESNQNVHDIPVADQNGIAEWCYAIRSGNIN